MHWSIIVWLTLLFASLMVMGLVDDYYRSLRRGWKPIIDFPKVWKRIKEMFAK